MIIAGLAIDSSYLGFFEVPLFFMTSSTHSNDQVINKGEHYKEALEDALWILFYYESDSHNLLANESVIYSMEENFSYSINDASKLLNHALVIHRERMKSGYYGS